MIGHNPVVETLKIFDTNKEKPLEFLHTRSFININAATGWAVSSGGKFPYENKIRLPISDDDFPVTLEYQPHATIQPNAVESCAPSNFPYIETTGINEVTLYAFSIPSPTTMLPIVVNLTQTGSPYGATNASAARSSVEQTAIQLSQNYFVVETQNDLLKKEEVINYVITAYKGGEMVEISAPSESPANWIFQQDGTPITGTSIVISGSLDDYSINVTLTLPQGTLIRNGIAVVYFPINAGGVFYPRATVNTTEAAEIIDQVESYEIKTSDLSRSSNNTYFVDGVPLSGSGSGLRVTTNKKTINGVVTTAAGELRFYSSGNTLRHTQATSGNALITLPNLEKFNADNSIDMVFYIGGQEVAREMLLIGSAGYSVILQTTSEYIVPEVTREVGVSSFYLLEAQSVVRKTGTIRIYQNEVSSETLLKEASGVSELSYSLMSGDDFISLEGINRFVITFTDIDNVMKAQRSLPIIGIGDASVIWSLVPTPAVLTVRTDGLYNIDSSSPKTSEFHVYRNGVDVSSDFTFAAELVEPAPDFAFTVSGNSIEITSFSSTSSHVGVFLTATNTQNSSIKVFGSLQAIRRAAGQETEYYVHIRYTDDPDNPSSPLDPISGLYMGVAVTEIETAPTEKSAYKWTLNGKDGNGVSGTETHYVVSDSGSSIPGASAGWSTTFPALIKGKYLWTRITISYTEGAPSVSYSTAYIAIDGVDAIDWTIGSDGFWYANGVKTDKKAVPEDGTIADIWTIGVNGNWYKNGADTGNPSRGAAGYTPIKGVDYFDGVDGQDGTTIVSAVVDYKNHINGTTAPTGEWDESPSPVKGQYLWTRTVTTYSNNDVVTTYSVAYQAVDGTDGLPGKGISTTLVEYVKSTTSTMPSTGWSTTRPTVNKGEYLWTRTTINYTSGSPSVSISNSYVPTDGQSGTSAYLWVRYSQNANGNPMTPSPVDAKYIGVATTSTSTAPTEYNLYSWSLIKGQDGVPGETGQDGKTSYLHIKYSNDGGTTFTSNNGETVGDWIGTYVDFIEEDSDNTSFYTWNKVKGDTGYTPIKGVDYFDGIDGQDGKGIVSSIVRYQNHTNGTTPPTGTWTENPSPIKGQYLWTRTVTTYTEGSPVPTYSVAYQAIDGTDGTDGKGIVSTVVDYVKSTTATMPSSGWSTTRPTVNKGEYLWTRTTITYTSGSPSVSISNSYVPTDGQNGTSSYLWVRYSQNANGNPMTTSPTNAKYIGVATTSTDTAPSEYGNYQWSLIKGTDGIPGENGIDGQTSYLHIKYSNDGGLNFTGNGGEDVGAWIGAYVDFIEADSTSVSSYTWNKVKGEQGPQGETTPSVLIVETDMDFNIRPGTQTQSRIAIYRDGVDITGDFEFDVELTEQETEGFEYSLDGNVITIIDFKSVSNHIGFLITGTHTESQEIVVIGSMQAIRRSPDEELRYYTHIMYTDDPDELDLEESPLSTTTGEYLGVAVTLTDVPPQDKESYKWTLSSQSIRVVEGSKTEYKLSENGTVAPENNDWSTRVPELEQGHYLWTRVTMYFSDDTESQSYSVSYIAIDGQESYRVEFFSETGFVYEKGSNKNVVIEARVMQGNRNATQDTFLGIEWTRISGNREADERFNKQGRSGARLTLRKEDLGDGATYQCDVYFLNQKGLLSYTSESIQAESPSGWIVGDEINGVPIDKSRNYILGSDKVKQFNQSLPTTVDNDFDWSPAPAPASFPTTGASYQLSQALQTNIDYKLILDNPIGDWVCIWGNNNHVLAILEPYQVEVTINSEVEDLDSLILKSSTGIGSISKIALTQWASEFEGTPDLSRNTIELTPDPSGTEGTVQYVHIRYSSDANGGHMTYGLEDDTAYIGLLNSISLFGSESSADYSWSPLSGGGELEGISGPEEWSGIYTWVKYADTPTTGMSDYPNAKTYIGLASNKTTATESLQYEDYEWSLIPQNIELRGRNLLRGSGVEVSNGVYNIASYDLTDEIEGGEEVTLRIWGSLAATKTNFRVYNSGGSVSVATLTDNEDGTYSSTFPWVIGSSTNTYLNVYTFTNAQTGISTINKIKLEKGSTATDWTPAPEDFVYWSLAPEEQPLNLEISELGVHWLTGQTVVTVDSEKESAQNVIAVREEINRTTQIIDDVEGRLTTNLTQVTTTIETVQNGLSDTEDSIVDILAKQVTHQNSIDATAEWQTHTLSRVDGQDQEISTLKQTAQSWEQSFKKSGGANLIKNSVGFKGTNFWTTAGTITVINSSTSASGKLFQLGGSTNNWIRQKVDLMQNEEYSINMLVSAVTASVNFRGVKLLYKEGGVSKELVLLDFPGSSQGDGVFNGTFSENFTTEVWTDTEIMIANNVVSGSSIFSVSDFGLYRGHNSVGWQQHAGESYTSFVQMDIDGITVYGKTVRDGVESVDEDSRTVMSPQSFAGYFADQKIFELSQYDTRVESLVVGQRGIHISPIKMIPNKERESIVEVWTGFTDGDVL